MRGDVKRGKEEDVGWTGLCLGGYLRCMNVCRSYDSFGFTLLLGENAVVTLSEEHF